MANLSIYGPGLAGNPVPPLGIPTRYTAVPFSEHEAAQKAEDIAASEREKANTRNLVMQTATAKVPVGEAENKGIARDDSDFSDDEGSTTLLGKRGPTAATTRLDRV